ncbi:fluoride efflux transporter CrcB [Sporomusa acidovorans]|uniref:fluoride efflux transporter CrcB n=1 Tax=Sporomusa acidovorans TaxID=112900 RepID=UPI002481E20F|nr:fluoride efflux transporter CrcB [Sporomusa acidovorans]
MGGGIGSVVRYAVSLWAADKLGTLFPYGTLLVNVVGCFIIGLFMTLVTEKFIANPYWRLLITTGFLGGFTTFSSYSYESLKLLEDTGVMAAFNNIAANLIIGLMATWVGIKAARVLF